MHTILIAIIAFLAGAGASWAVWRRKALAADRSEAELKTSISVLERELQITQEAHRRELAQHEESLTRQLAVVTDQLKAATAEALKARADELSQSNARDMNAILSPLRDNIREMRQAIDTQRDMEGRNTAAIRQAITDVMLHTQAIGAEADKLARALRRENKTQGNWGEVILAELLESQGLRKGINYEVQPTLTDDAGRAILNADTDRRMVPDVILHYADGRDMIIDAKTSLTAYLDYDSAESEADRRDALARHIRSMRDHVKELAAKDYKRYIRHPRHTLDYMIMFVPVEGALRLALDADPTLWRDALQMGVFISGEYCLTAALRIVHLTWRQEVQAQNQRKVVEEAETMLERVGRFYRTFQDIGRHIQALEGVYADAEKKLATGRQSVLVPARRLKEMGVRQSQRYPLPDAPEELPEAT